MADVVIVGAGGHGMVVWDMLAACAIRVIAFVDSDTAKHGTRVMDVPVFATIDDVPGKEARAIAMGVGDNIGRRREFEQLRDRGLEIIRVVHPSAVVSHGARLGVGVVVMPNVVVNVGTDVGDNVILNTACSVDHHCTIGPHSHVAPGAIIAGGVRVGQQTLIGAGAVIVPGVSLGARCVLGAGAVALHDVPDDGTFVGAPARSIQRSH
jgi:sugar O-acyltransferase (sialic acid O-acetyltransferase NeuD family)